ncbi:MAG: hypothetical protein QME51_05850 [Planctomycetota bacterium]|nr:hypothetical protein [Planctomycetota bacterium]MDI6787875.1 hypothetical protein [Planctomycetota bacterium]
MRNQLIVLGCVISVIVLSIVGCETKEKRILRERLAKAQQELEQVRTNLEKTFEQSKKIPLLEKENKELADQLAKIKSDMESISKEKETPIQKNNALVEENAKQKKIITDLKEEQINLKRQIKELKEALKSF